MFKALRNGEFAALHDRNTRQASFAVPNFQRLSLTQRSISYLGPVTWNSLPIELRTIDKIGRFKNLLKEYLLNLY